MRVDAGYGLSHAGHVHRASFSDADGDGQVIYVNTLTRRAVYALILNKDPFYLDGDRTVP